MKATSGLVDRVFKQLVFAFYINTLGVQNKWISMYFWLDGCTYAIGEMFPSCLLILNITTNVAYLFVNARGDAYISIHFLWVIWKWQIKWILLIIFSIRLFFYCARICLESFHCSFHLVINAEHDIDKLTLLHYDVFSQTSCCSPHPTAHIHTEPLFSRHKVLWMLDDFMYIKQKCIMTSLTESFKFMLMLEM